MEQRITLLEGFGSWHLPSCFEEYRASLIVSDDGSSACIEYSAIKDNGYREIFQCGVGYLADSVCMDGGQSEDVLRALVAFETRATFLFNQVGGPDAGGSFTEAQMKQIANLRQALYAHLRL